MNCFCEGNKKYQTFYFTISPNSKLREIPKQLKTKGHAEKAAAVEL